MPVGSCCLQTSVRYYGEGETKVVRKWLLLFRSFVVNCTNKCNTTTKKERANC